MQSRCGKSLLVVLAVIGLIGLAIVALLILRDPAEDRLNELGKIALVMSGLLLGFWVYDWLRHTTGQDGD